VEAAWTSYEGSRSQASQATPPQPYEKLITVIQDVCHRTGNDSFIFPVQTLIPEVCRYALENGQDRRIGADVQWPVALFVQLGVSHDLITRILERMYESQEIPFRGAGRTRVVEWITSAVSSWVKEVSRRGGNERGLEPWVGDLMAECSSVVRSARGNEGGLEVAELGREVAEVKRNVDGLVGGVGRGSFGGSLGFM
jgi:nuclear pore complex protein Nup155